MAPPKPKVQPFEWGLLLIVDAQMNAIEITDASTQPSAEKRKSLYIE